ncbi:MAG: D-alanyl-D-alanine carboxypeptidase family protein [Oscillospiraceae bacterium]|nr:D-alanyl-D-alanine carboxypeptidase family protein [Oscillospiraceae bacterium]
MRTVRLSHASVFEGPVRIINRWSPLRGDTRPPLSFVSADIQLEAKACCALQACLQAVGLTKEIVPVSGWRSRAQQQQIWDESLAENGESYTRCYVAPPACSEHEAGLAIDLAKKAAHIDFICPAFSYDGACGLFRREAARFGFIERYQKDKEAVTGISAEPWHFRYVGLPHARLIEENGLCLEEYPGFLAANARRVSLADGNTARVFYVPCEREGVTLTLPETPFEISGDNQKGFIVTVWEGCL